MAVNLIELVMQYLTPERIQQIAAAFNLEPKTMQGAAKVSIPSLLAGLASIALQPGGAQKVVDGVGQHAGALDNFSSAIGGSTNQSAIADKGLQWLSSLLGGQNQAALAGAVAKFCGLSQGASGSILGLLTPVVLGMISKGVFRPQCVQSHQPSRGSEKQHRCCAAFRFRRPAAGHWAAQCARWRRRYGVRRHQ
jgi:hypothetical protein